MLSGIVRQMCFNRFDKLCEGSQRVAIDNDAAIGRCIQLSQFGDDVLDDYRVLLTIVFCVCEEEREQSLLTEFVKGPEERRHGAVKTGRDVGGSVLVATLGRSPDLEAFENASLEAEFAVALSLLVIQRNICSVKEEQVFALDVVDHGLCVQGFLSKNVGREQVVEDERRIRRFGRYAGNAADVDVTAACSIQEFKIDPCRFFIA